MRRIKTWVRTSMYQERFTNLSIVHMEKDVTKNMDTELFLIIIKILNNMEWNDEQSLKLIQLYKDHPILWDPTCSQYKLGKKKIENWREIATELNTNAVEAKKKIESTCILS
ncbi:hypothetical protein QTP88_022815 [Uroleucon formosanum]